MDTDARPPWDSENVDAVASVRPIRICRMIVVVDVRIDAIRPGSLPKRDWPEPSVYFWRLVHRRIIGCWPFLKPQSLTSTTPPLKALVEAVRWSPTTIPTCFPSDMTSPIWGWPFTMTYGLFAGLVDSPSLLREGTDLFGAISGDQCRSCQARPPRKCCTCWQKACPKGSYLKANDGRVFNRASRLALTPNHSGPLTSIWRAWA